MRTKSRRLAGYEKFLDQEIDADGDLIEEVMMMDEAEPIKLDQAMNDSNQCATMKEELREIQKNKTWELVKRSNKKPINLKWV